MTVKKKQASKPNHARTLELAIRAMKEFGELDSPSAELARELAALPTDKKLDVAVNALDLLTLALMKEARRSERLRRQVAKLKAAAKVVR